MKLKLWKKMKMFYSKCKRMHHENYQNRIVLIKRNLEQNRRKEEKIY